MPWGWNFWSRGLDASQQNDSKSSNSSTRRSLLITSVTPAQEWSSNAKVVEGIIGESPRPSNHSVEISSPRKRRIGEAEKAGQSSKKIKLPDDASTEEPPADSVKTERPGLPSKRRRSRPPEDDGSLPNKRIRANSTDASAQSTSFGSDGTARQTHDANIQVDDPISGKDDSSRKANSTALTAGQGRRHVLDEENIAVPTVHSTTATTSGVSKNDGSGPINTVISASEEYATPTEPFHNLGTPQKRLDGVKLSLERTAHARHGRHGASNDHKRPCPSGRLVGVGEWPGSSHIPGQLKSRVEEPDLIELPVTKGRFLRKSIALGSPESRIKKCTGKDVAGVNELPLLYELKEQTPEKAQVSKFSNASAANQQRLRPKKASTGLM